MTRYYKQREKRGDRLGKKTVTYITGKGLVYRIYGAHTN